VNGARDAAATMSPIGHPPSLRRSLIRYCLMGLVLASVLRLVSGRADWLRAWFYVGFTLGIQVVVGVVLQRVNPDLLVERSRLQKGTKPWDKVLAPVVAILGPLAIWCVAAWDVRVHWPPVVSIWWSAAAFAVCALGCLVTFWAMVTNPFFSATVRIQEERGHRVIDGGPYRYVRHPGYCGALAFSIASPVALGSWLALIPAAFTAGVLVIRTSLEDRTLRAELEGYQEYARQVPSRLVPGLW
jgi:protein-S-isoprenylcysteine O-methyltransferase Ste14